MADYHETSNLSEEELAGYQKRSAEIPVIGAEEFAAAQRDPKVREFLEEARAEADRWEPTEWGLRLKREYRPDNERGSVLRRGLTFVSNVGRAALSGNLGTAISHALGRHF